VSTPRDRADHSEQLRQLRLLHDAARRLNATLDLDTVLDAIVADVAERFNCSRSAVLLCDPDRRELELVAVRGWSPDIHPKGFRFRIGLDGLVGRVASTGRTLYTPDVRLEPKYEVSEPTTLSEIDIPLIVRGEVIGVFNAQHPEVDAFAPAQRELLETLADHVATAIANARLFKRESEARERLEREAAEARRMQQSLLPAPSVRIGGFQLTGVCEPIRSVGGDWFDYFAVDDHRWAVVLGDVSGKGQPAALLMSAARGMLRQQVRAGCSAAQSLERVNRFLCDDFPPGRFVTVVLGILDIRQPTLQLASAGHPPPILVNGTNARLLGSADGRPLGLMASDYSESVVTLVPGDVIIFYSDGCIEASNERDEELGPSGLADLVSGRARTATDVLSLVHRFAASALADDATVLTISRD
jgi:sigma-B regulation protein RsbU (phosphoserine phosphatase)